MLGLRPVVSLKPGHQTAASTLLVLSKLEVKSANLPAGQMAVRWADPLTGFQALRRSDSNSSAWTGFPDIRVVRVVQVLRGVDSQSLDVVRARSTSRQQQATNPRPMAYHSYQLPLSSL